jgi:hypothetical protein
MWTRRRRIRLAGFLRRLARRNSRLLRTLRIAPRLLRRSLRLGELSLRIDTLLLRRRRQPLLLERCLTRETLRLGLLLRRRTMRRLVNAEPTVSTRTEREHDERSERRRVHALATLRLQLLYLQIVLPLTLGLLSTLTRFRFESYAERMRFTLARKALFLGFRPPFSFELRFLFGANAGFLFRTNASFFIGTPARIFFSFATTFPLFRLNPLFLEAHQLFEVEQNRGLFLVTHRHCISV